MNRVIEGEIVAVTHEKPRGSALAVVSVVLLASTLTFGVLFARERSARDDDRVHLRALNARSVQRATALAAELAVVRAQRDQAVSRLVRADGLSPEAVDAIRACVLRYAEYERTPGADLSMAETACTNAEPYVR